jgi:long-subunit fatty acid transport protein
MRVRGWILLVGIAGMPQLAAAGGLLLPGAGAVSTSRAGAAVASADDGEALVLNPAGIAKASGNTITVSAAMIQYAMEFQRRGTYDTVPGESYPYAGQPYALVKNDVSPPLGIGSVQPVPVVAFLSDLGGRLGGLHVGIGLYAPNAYPFRDMCTQQANGCQRYVFQTDANGDFNTPPPGTRYDIVTQDAEVFLPSLVLAYRIVPSLDVGLRLTAGTASVNDTAALWGALGPNYEEDPRKDALLTIDAADNFVPGFGLGVTFRPTPAIELGANYSSELDLHAKGTARSQLGPSASSQQVLPPPLPPVEVQIVPLPDTETRCATGGTPEALKGCVDFAVPMSLQIGGRYKFLDETGRTRGDIELDLDWENWGKSCSDDDLLAGRCTSPSDYRVVVDATAAAVTPLGPVAVAPLRDGIVRHGLTDSYGVRLGGSYRIPVGARREGGASNELIVRGGVGYDTAAAKTGWLRADIDGAARTTLTVGAAYRTQRLEVSLGGGAILEGTPSNPNSGGGAQPCNPMQTTQGCTGTGQQRPIPDREGPDPINPISTPDMQVESPVTQGDYRAHYLLLMLGVSTWF